MLNEKEKDILGILIIQNMTETGKTTNNMVLANLQKITLRYLENGKMGFFQRMNHDEYFLIKI